MKTKRILVLLVSVFVILSSSFVVQATTQNINLAISVNGVVSWTPLSSNDSTQFTISRVSTNSIVSGGSNASGTSTITLNSSFLGGVSGEYTFQLNELNSSGTVVATQTIAFYYNGSTFTQNLNTLMNSSGIVSWNSISSANTYSFTIVRVSDNYLLAGGSLGNSMLTTDMKIFVRNPGYYTFTLQAIDNNGTTAAQQTITFYCYGSTFTQVN